MNNELAVFFGRFHPVLVHLPIGLLVLLGWLELVSRWPRFKHANRGVGLVMAIAVPLSVGTAVCGWLLSWEGGYDPRLLQLHKWTGVATAAATVVVTFLYWLDLQTVYRLALFGTVGLLFVSSHFGGSLTHGGGYLVQYAPDPLRKALRLAPKASPRKPAPALAPAADPREEQKPSPIFTSLIHPVLDDKCVACHGPEKAKGGMRLDSFEALMKGGETGAAVVAGKPAESDILRRLLLPIDDDEHMPPDGKPQLSPDDIALVRWWIEEGADPEKTVADVKPAAIIARILRERLAPVALSAPSSPPAAHVAIPSDESAPAPQKEIASAVSEIARDLAVPLTFLGEKEDWLQVNAGVLGSEFGDADLNRLASVGKNLRWLDLSGTAVTDDGLTNLTAMPNLSRLYLQRTKITDHGLQKVAALQKLDYLNLYATEVTDAGLKSLEGLPSLRQLYLWKTKVTPERAKSFADAGVDHEQIKAWEKEIEALHSRIRAQHITVDVGIAESKPTASPAAEAMTSHNTECPVSGKPVDPSKTVMHEGKLVAFCCDICKGKFEADPKPFLEALKLKTAPAASTR